MAASETYTIGKVVKKLVGTYPDLTVSKVRFLEAEGLVSPTRTKSGYRVYTDKDVERLEQILRLQKTCFYPLAVIKERLDALEPGQTLEELETPLAPEDDEALLNAVHMLEDVPSLINVPVPFVRTLQEAGLIQIRRSPAGRNLVDGQDMPLIKAAYELKHYGIDPRFLRPHVQRVNREIPLYKQALATTVGRQGSLEDPKTRRSFDSALERIIALNNTVSDSLIRRGVRSEFNYPAAQA